MLKNIISKQGKVLQNLHSLQCYQTYIHYIVIYTVND